MEVWVPNQVTSSIIMHLHLRMKFRNCADAGATHRAEVVVDVATLLKCVMLHDGLMMSDISHTLTVLEIMIMSV